MSMHAHASVVGAALAAMQRPALHRGPIAGNPAPTKTIAACADGMGAAARKHPEPVGAALAAMGTSLGAAGHRGQARCHTVTP